MVRDRSLEELERKELVAIEKHQHTLDYQRNAITSLAKELDEKDQVLKL